MKKTMSVLAIVGVVLITGVLAHSAMVTLDLQIDTDGPGTWSVYAEISGGTAGLSDFGLNVVGSGGAMVTDSTNMSPMAVDWDGSTLTQYGFNEQRSDGWNGVGIVANQPSIYPGENDPERDAMVLQGVGISAGSQAGYIQSAVWDVPVLLAEGTYSLSSPGEITVSGIPVWNLLSIVGSGWEGPGNLETASEVESDTEPVVPEPATLSLLVIGGLALLRRKR